MSANIRKSKILKQKKMAVGMAEKAKEFVATDGEIYHGNLLDGAKKYESK